MATLAQDSEQHNVKVMNSCPTAVTSPLQFRVIVRLNGVIYLALNCKCSFLFPIICLWK